MALSEHKEERKLAGETQSFVGSNLITKLFIELKGELGGAYDEEGYLTTLKKASTQYTLPASHSDIRGLIKKHSQADKSWGLDLKEYKRPLNDKNIDEIIDDIEKSASMTYLRFNQSLTDAQAKKLLLHLTTMPSLLYVCFPGHLLQDETAAAFAQLGCRLQREQERYYRQSTGTNHGIYGICINITRCPHYEKRCRSESRIVDLEFSGHFIESDYTTNDITRLTEILQRTRPKLRRMALTGGLGLCSYSYDYTNAAWADFFATAFSVCKVSEIYIHHDAIISEEAWCAIFNGIANHSSIKDLAVKRPPSPNACKALARALSHNRSLEVINLGKYRLSVRPGLVEVIDKNDVKVILFAIANNPHLPVTELYLDGLECGDENGEALKKLLCQTKTLRRLTLEETGIGDNTHRHLLEALNNNKTLTLLQVSHYGRQQVYKPFLERNFNIMQQQEKARQVRLSKRHSFFVNPSCNRKWVAEEKKQIQVLEHKASDKRSNKRRKSTSDINSTIVIGSAMFAHKAIKHQNAPVIEEKKCVIM